MLQECFKYASSMFQVCFKYASRPSGGLADEPCVISGGETGDRTGVGPGGGPACGPGGHALVKQIFPIT